LFFWYFGISYILLYQKTFRVNNNTWFSWRWIHCKQHCCLVSGL